MSALSSPFRIDTRHRTSESADAAHVRELIAAVLFTSPGERVNRPDFGCGLKELVFAGNDPALAGSVEITVGGALQRWLGDEIEVQAIEVRAEDGVLRIDLAYALRRTGERHSAVFKREA